MEPKRHRYRSCTGKFAFQTRAQAETVAERKAKEWKIDGDRVWLNVYLCPHCRQFHIGRNYQ